jgi:hypothetical protein
MLGICDSWSEPLMASIAFYAGLFCYSRLSGQVRSGIYQGNAPPMIYTK